MCLIERREELDLAREVDVVVVGGGNAGFCAALAAAERGRSVVLLEKGQEESAGGNSFYTAGATRISHEGLNDLLDIVVDDERHDRTDVPSYLKEQYASDLAKVTGGRNDPVLTEVLVDESAAGVRWLTSHGIRYRLMYERQAYERADGSYLFWGGLHIGNVNGGRGLMADHARAAQRLGVDVRLGNAVLDIRLRDGVVDGVLVEGRTEGYFLHAESVVIASGGFEANSEMRRTHLGDGWENAKVRGTPLNTGEMLEVAIRLGAARGGDWGTCHSVAWDAWHPGNESNRQLTNRLTRQSYPLGIVVNLDGRRFLDEGADFRNYTYAKYGREILAQPGSVAFQIFDAQTRSQLRPEEYDMPGVSVLEARTLEELARKAQITPDTFLETVREFNEAIDALVPLDPNVLDGRASHVDPPKSNWATSISRPPYFAYPVTCGITFTFGGLRGDVNGRVLNLAGAAIPGLFAAGEALGGLFSGNYPGGTGLAAGIVFGRRAGSIA